LLRHLVEVEHIAAEPQRRIALQKKYERLGQILGAPVDKFFLTAYGDSVLPEARCLSREIIKNCQRSG